MNFKVIKTAYWLASWTTNGPHDDKNVALIKRISARKVLRRFKDHSTIILEYKMSKTSQLHVAASGCMETLDGGAILGGRVTTDAITWPVVDMVLTGYTALKNKTIG